MKSMILCIAITAHGGEVIGRTAVWCKVGSAAGLVRSGGLRLCQIYTICTVIGKLTLL